MIQAIYRSNFIIMGAPLIANLFNTDKIPLTALLLAVVVPFYNVSSVIILEIFRGNDISAKKIFSGIAHNPLLRGALLGLILSILHITLPTVIEKPISEIAKAASPLALIILGASFQPVSKLSGGYQKLIICILGKLILVPAFGLGAAWLLGYRGMELAILIAVFGTPTAVSSYAMAQQMESDDTLTSNCIVFSSGLACITFFFWIFCRSGNGLTDLRCPKIATGNISLSFIKIFFGKIIVIGSSINDFYQSSINFRTTVGTLDDDTIS